MISTARLAACAPLHWPGRRMIWRLKARFSMRYKIGTFVQFLNDCMALMLPVLFKRRIGLGQGDVYW